MSPRVSSSKPPVEPTHEQIAERAFYVFLDRSRSGQSGTPEGDWSQAEEQLRAELSAAPPRARQASASRAKKPAARAKAAAAGRVEKPAGSGQARTRRRKP